MAVDIAEELVGAYLAEIEKCDHVLYNVRAPGGGLQGLRELDVIGLRFSDKAAYLCEVTTHLRGLLIGNYASTIKKIKEKHDWQVEYAKNQLKDFKPEFQFWSPWVPRGALLQGLGEITGLRLVVNSDYTRRVKDLQNEAKKQQPSPTNNMAYRLIQILEHLREADDSVDPQTPA